MSRHAGPPRADDAPPIPEPTFAERARTLAYLGRTGTLATLSRRRPGHPFASVMPYALDDAGRPLFLISSMAMHTQNLEADARASLLVLQPDWTGDPLAAGRLTLMGEARRPTRPRWWPWTGWASSCACAADSACRARASPFRARSPRPRRAATC